MQCTPEVQYMASELIVAIGVRLVERTATEQLLIKRNFIPLTMELCKT